MEGARPFNEQVKLESNQLTAFPKSHPRLSLALSYCIYYTILLVFCQEVFENFFKNSSRLAADRFSSSTISRVTVILAS